MRCVIGLALCLLAVCPATGADPPPKLAPITHYDPDPAHLWNRLHATLLTRPDRDGTTIGRDALDPVVFPTTKRLLEGPTHAEAVALLDEFLGDGHEAVRDPVKRAVMQRDLWAVFDWATYPFGNFYTTPIEIRTGPLQKRLAKAIRKLAPSKAEAEELLDTYARAVESKMFPIAFDPAKPNDPFLAPDLFDPAGPWVCVTGPSDLPTPVASEHVRVSAGRSTFLVFIRLPEGRKATLAYLAQLDTFPNPRTAPRALNREVPQFPAGTQVALVRQLIVVTADGVPTPTRLTESVQFRTYREILPPEMESDSHAAKAQGFVELELRRADLFAEKNGGMRAIKGDDLVRRALTFFRGWDDPYEATTEVTHSHDQLEPAFRQCAACHARGGIHGVNSYSQTGVVRPTLALGLFSVSIADVQSQSAQWKTGLKDWAELRKLAEW